MPSYRIQWLEEAKADVRALDQNTAMRMFEGILRFARSGSGDLAALQGDLAGLFRLRLGGLSRHRASSASDIAARPIADRW
jgi:hypothetical protein